MEPINVSVKVPELFSDEDFKFTINSPVTCFIGPNGSGKTQVLRKLKTKLAGVAGGKKVRYLSSGRMSPLENFRSDYDGRRGEPRYDQASLGGIDNRNYRHRNETILGDFHTLSIRKDIQIKVIERLRTLFNRDMSLEWDAGNLKVMLSRNDVLGKEYSVAREASGLLQLVAILSALYDDEVGILLLDEPEISMHPQLQSFLLKEIFKASGDPSVENKKLVIYSTHSPEMFKINNADDLVNLVFFRNVRDLPIQLAVSAGELKNKKIKELIPRLNYSHKMSFFSTNPLLVEGISDSIICSFIDDYMEMNMSTAGAQIIPVIGKGQIPVVYKLMVMIGKKPVILTDLDSIADGLDLVSLYNTDNVVNEIVRKLGHSDFSTFSRNVFTDFCQLVETEWDDISEYAMKHSYWILRDAKKDEEIAKRRSSLAVILSQDSEEGMKISEFRKWENIAARMNTLFDTLEEVGCFILRKGTVENYYISTSENISSLKPTAAIEETEYIIKNNPEDFIESYSDIIRSIHFVSQTEPIDESKQIMDLLLQVVGPILGSLNEKSTTESINIKAKQVLKNDVELFDIELVNDTDVSSVKVGLKSKILENYGFPITFEQGCNLVQIAKKIKQ